MYGPTVSVAVALALPAAAATPGGFRWQSSPADVATFDRLISVSLPSDLLINISPFRRSYSVLHIHSTERCIARY
jgi:hypothetical protein